MRLHIVLAVGLALVLPEALCQLIGVGNMCLGSDYAKGCDYELTNLVCFEGRCACPESGGRMSSLALPSTLNTKWHDGHHKCFATRGFMCDLHPTKKRVDCLPGVSCIQDPNNPGAGTCAASALLRPPFLVSALLTLLIFFQK